ncbi:MAG: hypothetical protein RL095_958 [Verrucomicrobiota bacterium]|jgi:hypothetical protein
MKEIVAELLQLALEILIEGGHAAWKSLAGACLGAILGGIAALCLGSDEAMIPVLTGLGLGFLAGFLLDLLSS